MGEWHTLPDTMDEGPRYGIFDRETLDAITRKKDREPIPVPPGFVPERLKGNQQQYQPRSQQSVEKRAQMEEREKLLREGNLNFAQIALKFRVSRTSISMQAAKLGITSPGQQVHGTRGVSMTQREKLIREGKEPYAWIAKQFGVDPTAISAQARKMGMVPRRTGGMHGSEKAQVGRGEGRQPEQGSSSQGPDQAPRPAA